MGVLDLFVASTMSVLNVLILTALGAFLALEPVGLLGEDARLHVNNLVFYVFNPALIAGNLADTITYDSLVNLWFMPVNILITFIIGSVLGLLVNLITRPPPHLRGLVIGCCAAGNLGNILIIIVPAVCQEKGAPFGDADICTTYGLAYASLSLAIGAIYLWIYVYNIVRISIEGHITTTSQPGKSSIEPLLPPKDNVTSQEHGAVLPYSSLDGKTQMPWTTRLKNQLAEISEKLNLKKIFAPSINGAIVGFAIGLIPALRNLMIGDTAPFRVIENATILVGEAAIPVLTIIVGANLLKGLRASGIKMYVVAGIIAARYIILPLSGVIIVKAAIRFNLVPEDPLYRFVLYLHYAVPPAMNMGTITQLFGAGQSECSVIMLWTYVVAMVSLTLWCTYFLWLVA